MRKAITFIAILVLIATLGTFIYPDVCNKSNQNLPTEIDRSTNLTQILKNESKGDLMSYVRTKKMTDSAVLPTWPASETIARNGLDAPVQEVYDMLAGTTAGSSGAKYTGTPAIVGISGNDVETQLSSMKSYTDGQLSAAVLGQIPDNTLTDAKLASGGVKDTLSSHMADYLNLKNNFDSHLVDSPISVTAYSSMVVAGDWTSAFQAAIDTKRPVLIPPSTAEYLITDSLKVYQGTTIIGAYSSSNLYDDGSVKINFNPATAKDLFILHDVPPTMDYVYGIAIGGFSVKGNAVAGYVFNLPRMSNLRLWDVKQYGGFDYGMIIDGYIDCNMDRVCFMGTRIAAVNVIAPYLITTTTRFNSCYFSQGDKSFTVAEGATNYLIFNDCVFESLNMIGDIQTNNNVFLLNPYIENCPKTDAGYAFTVGKVGAKTANTPSIFSISGAFIKGFATAVNTGLIDADFIKNIYINDADIEQYHHLIAFTENTKAVTMDNVVTSSVTNLGLPTNPWNALSATGGYMQYVALDSVNSNVFIGIPDFKSFRSNAGNPNGVLYPVRIGEEVLDTTNLIWYKAVGYANSSWKALN